MLLMQKEEGEKQALYNADILLSMAALLPAQKAHMISRPCIQSFPPTKKKKRD